MAPTFREVYRGYEVKLEPDGGGHYLSARPLRPDLPILSNARMKVLCSQEVGILIAAILLFTVLFSLGVFEGEQGADGNIEAPTTETPQAE